MFGKQLLWNFAKTREILISARWMATVATGHGKLYIFQNFIFMKMYNFSWVLWRHSCDLLTLPLLSPYFQVHWYPFSEYWIKYIFVWLYCILHVPKVMCLQFMIFPQSQVGQKYMWFITSEGVVRYSIISVNFIRYPK